LEWLIVRDMGARWLYVEMQVERGIDLALETSQGLLWSM
jgi:hypothetical protein